MSMDKINGSQQLRPGILDSARQNEQVNADKTWEAKGTQAADAVPTGTKQVPGDTVEISATAHRLMELRQALETGYAAIAALPETRQDKVAQARENLQAGSNDSAAVREKVAGEVEKVLEGMEKL